MYKIVESSGMQKTIFNSNPFLITKNVQKSVKILNRRFLCFSSVHRMDRYKTNNNIVTPLTSEKAIKTLYYNFFLLFNMYIVIIWYLFSYSILVSQMFIQNYYHSCWSVHNKVFCISQCYECGGLVGIQGLMTIIKRSKMLTNNRTVQYCM